MQFIRRIMSATHNSVIRPSASLIIAAPVRRTHAGLNEANYKILMLKRNARSSFVNAHVFPGGNLDKFDKDMAWHDMFPLTSLGEGLLNAYKLCAIRETFEESGILLAEPWGSSVTGLAAWRKSIQADAKNFHSLIMTHKLKPTISKLYHLSQWITPTIELRRYNTHFFLTVLPDDPFTATLLTSINTDEEEITQFDWFYPYEALSKWRNGDITLFPPQLYIIMELDKVKDINNLSEKVGLGSFRERDSRKVVTICPEFRPTFEDDPLHKEGFEAFAAMPGDELYSHKGMTGTRHRFYIKKLGGRFVDMRIQKNLDVNLPMGTVMDEVLEDIDVPTSKL